MTNPQVAWRILSTFRSVPVRKRDRKKFKGASRLLKRKAK